MRTEAKIEGQCDKLAVSRHFAVYKIACYLKLNQSPLYAARKTKKVATKMLKKGDIADIQTLVKDIIKLNILALPGRTSILEDFVKVNHKTEYEEAITDSTDSKLWR
jgi:hypothetical protein